ncbi:hypothetical protein ACFCXA_03300 [Streptomyces virginiae]|uniref:hypothetical protein n=1 Tax=Streptomyces virginiae TaxID=1961 RepID=UPI0035DA064E
MSSGALLENLLSAHTLRTPWTLCRTTTDLIMARVWPAHIATSRSGGCDRRR